MASPTVDISHGITITFGTSGFSAEVTDITPPAASRENVDTSHQGTTNFKTFTPADLAEWGELTFTCHFNPDTEPPIISAAETITLAFPAGSWSFSGFMTNYEPQASHLDKMTANVTVKVSGDITGPWDGSGS